MAKLSAGGRTCLLEVVVHRNDAPGASTVERRDIYRLMSDGKVLSNSKWKSAGYGLRDGKWCQNGKLELHDTGWKLGHPAAKAFMLQMIEAKASGKKLASWVKAIEVNQ